MSNDQERKNAEEAFEQESSIAVQVGMIIDEYREQRNEGGSISFEDFLQANGVDDNIASAARKQWEMIRLVQAVAS